MSNNQRKFLWAILAVLLSTLMWLYVSVVEDPEDSSEIRAVPINYIGEETLAARNLSVIENKTNTVRVTVDGRRTDLSLADNKNVSVIVDLSTITMAGTIKCAYEVVLPDNLKNSLRVSGFSPAYVDLFVDRTETKVIEVRLVSNIKPAEGYIAKLASSVIEPHEVRIKGPATILDKIEYAEITLNRDDVSQTIDSIMTYKYKDIDGNEISSDNITADFPEVWISIPVHITKTVSLNVDFRDGGGLTAADNVIHTITPEEITISGDPSVVDGINVITLAQIDLSKVEAAGSREYKIPLPNDCSSLSGEETAVVKLEFTGVRAETVVTTNIEIINADPPDGYIVEVKMNEASVRIRGPEHIIGLVKPGNIRVVVDLSGQTLIPGHAQYPATIYIDGYPRVGAVGDYGVAIEVKEDIP